VLVSNIGPLQENTKIHKYKAIEIWNEEEITVYPEEIVIQLEYPETDR
jgi:hypothetical protein